MYCQAFFWGCDIEVVGPGSKIVLQKTKDGKITKTKDVPDDFFGAHKISSRNNWQSGILQFHAGEINAALQEYKTRETFCILGVTNQDLYPNDEWNFVYGLANLQNATGVFSFCRHEVKFEDPTTDLSPEIQRQVWLKRSCGTMVHEITHMFGIKHCIYYECTMNGTNGNFESAGRSCVTLCPVCLVKLQMNIKFDAKTRYEKMIEASEAIGFTEQAQNYKLILEEANK